jgi:hypothetical protein
MGADTERGGLELISSGCSPAIETREPRREAGA